MSTGDQISGEIGDTIHRLEEQVDAAVGRSVVLHRAGGNEEAVLAETAVAVGAAKALEILTGESWEAQLERREKATNPDLPAPDGPPRDDVPRGRWTISHRRAGPDSLR